MPVSSLEITELSYKCADLGNVMGCIKATPILFSLVKALQVNTAADCPGIIIAPPGRQAPGFEA
jgi:hypothetical protein